MHNQESSPSSGSMYLYLLSNPFNLMPFYVGITNDPHQRLSSHASKYDNLERRQIISAIQSAGAEPHMTVVDLKPTLEMAQQSELAWVGKYKRLGFPLVNRELPAESRQSAVRFHLAAVGARPVVARVAAAIGPEEPPASARARRRALEAGKPENHGQPWSAEEVALVCSDFIEEVPLGDIAQKRGRTRYGILAKLKQLAESNPDIHDRLVEIGELEPGQPPA